MLWLSLEPNVLRAGSVQPCMELPFLARLCQEMIIPEVSTVINNIKPYEKGAGMLQSCHPPWRWVIQSYLGGSAATKTTPCGGGGVRFFFWLFFHCFIRYTKWRGFKSFDAKHRSSASQKDMGRDHESILSKVCNAGCDLDLQELGTPSQRCTMPREPARTRGALDW